MLVFVLQQSWKRIFSLYKIKSQHSASVRPRNISDVITLLVIRFHVTVVSLLQESKIKIMEMKYIYEEKRRKKMRAKEKENNNNEKNSKTFIWKREKTHIFVFRWKPFCLNHFDECCLVYGLRCTPKSVASTFLKSRTSDNNNAHKCVFRFTLRN